LPAAAPKPACPEAAPNADGPVLLDFETAALGRSSGVSPPLATTRLPSGPMGSRAIRDALSATFAVQALPAVLQHCHPRAGFPVPGCSEVSSMKE
jgi:hypothetical protein